MATLSLISRWYLEAHGGKVPEDWEPATDFGMDPTHYGGSGSVRSRIGIGAGHSGSMEISIRPPWRVGDGRCLRFCAMNYIYQRISMLLFCSSSLLHLLPTNSLIQL